jgi:excisionase family DNA binding protein
MGSNEMSATQDEPLMKVKDLADYLGYSHWAIYQLVKKEKIPYIKLPSGDLRFEKADIQAWKAMLKGGPTPEDKEWASTKERTPRIGGFNTSHTAKKSKSPRAQSTKQKPSSSSPDEKKKSDSASGGILPIGASRSRKLSKRIMGHWRSRV